MSGNVDIQEQLQQVVSRIIEIRKQKGLTLENMAEDLGISLAAYNKIEKQTTALTLERLFQIQIALNVTMAELLDIRIENVYNQSLHDSSVGHQVVKNLYQDNREITDKLVAALQDEIQFLRKQINPEA